MVGMDMLIKKFRPKDKLKKCLHLITNAQCATKEPYEGMKVDQAATIAHQMNSQGIRLNCLIIREKLWGVEHQLAIDENDKLLNQFSQQAVANIVHVDSTTSLLGAVKTRKINPSTVFRGDLELSPTMKIKVRSLHCYVGRFPEFGHTVHNYYLCCLLCFCKSEINKFSYLCLDFNLPPTLITLFTIHFLHLLRNTLFSAVYFLPTLSNTLSSTVHFLPILIFCLEKK